MSDVDLLMDTSDSGRGRVKCMQEEHSSEANGSCHHRSFASFEKHLRTNTVGPIIVAQKLLQTHISLGTILFMSSDSGSAANFRPFEDGYLTLVTDRTRLTDFQVCWLCCVQSSSESSAPGRI